MSNVHNTPLLKKIYPEKEIERIKNKHEQNNALIDFYSDKVKEWNDKLKPVYNVIGKHNLSVNNYKNIIDAQSSALSHLQDINYEISYFSQKLTKVLSGLRKIEQEKFLFYSTNFGLKTNQKEMKTLIDGNLREDLREKELLETHIEFLTNTSKTIQNYLYAIKNLSELYNYLGR